MSVTSHFQATPQHAGEHIELIRITQSRLPFGKATQEVVPFDDWMLHLPAGVTGAVARLMQSLADGEAAEDGLPLIITDTTGATLHSTLVARLAEPDAAAFGLPPATRLTLNLQNVGLIHQPDFRIEPRWTRAGGVAVRAQVSGARIRHDGTDHRLPEPFYSTLSAVARVAESGNDAARQEALAQLRATMGDEAGGRIAADGYIERLRLAYAAGFSLDLKVSGANFDFDPVLFGRERMDEAEDGPLLDQGADSLLPPAMAASFARRFRKGAAPSRTYLLDDGSILFLDPQLTQALAVVHEAQRGTPEQRRAFARNPARAVADGLRQAGEDPGETAALFVETQQFSERVSGIDIWRKPVLPWIKPRPNSWLPEKFGLRIGDEPDARMVEIALDRIVPARDAAEQALHEARASFSFDGQEIPATQATYRALDDLAALVKDDQTSDPNGAGPPPEIVRTRYFLQVRDNLEDVAYTPIGGEAGSPADLPPPALPSSLLSSPKPHQIDGFGWLTACWRSGMPGALLADDMGLGKTFQALAFLAWIRQEQPHPKPILIVAPTGLLANWRAEIERHLAPGTLGSIVNAYGTNLKAMRGDAGRDIDAGASGVDVEGWAHAGVVLTTYETMRDYHLSFARLPFAAIVYDEAQKLKNPASQMTRAAKTLNARFQLAMTGTPVENRLQDLWSIFDVIHPGLLGSSKAFETLYPATEPDRLQALHDLLVEPQGARPPLLLRRMKDDCLAGLPAKHVRAMPMPMPPVQAAAYSRAIGRALAVKGSGEQGRMLEVLHQLRGISLHPKNPEEAAGDERYFEDSARLDTVFTLLETIANAREKALIFCESLAMQALLAHEIRRRFALSHPVPRIHGGVAGDARQREVDAFQKRGLGFDAMILSPKAGGVGLTLTAANHVIHLSRWWNPAVEDQATDRAYRIGQERDVTVYLPQAVHPDPAIGPLSFDLKLHALMERKRSLSRGLLMPGEEDGDAGALFDAIVQDGGEVEAAIDEALSPPKSEPEQPAADTSRPRLSLRPRPASAPVFAPSRPVANYPRRIVYEPHGPRDLAIFQRPVNGEQIEILEIRDPYACAGRRARENLVEFVAMMLSQASNVAVVRLKSWDADSVGLNVPESTQEQHGDLAARWKARIGDRARLQHLQVSRFQDRRFHDREVRADTRSGRTLIWDLGSGIDGVMRRDRECRVTLTEE
jgi:hypothetical protein